jgi:RNA polymerase sigma-70 factor (ECF subfamily)
VEIAEELDTSEAAVKKAAQRLRQRYRDVLCAHIAATVSSPEEIDEEIRHLFSVLAG